MNAAYMQAMTKTFRYGQGNQAFSCCVHGPGRGHPTMDTWGPASPWQHVFIS